MTRHRARRPPHVRALAARGYSDDDLALDDPNVVSVRKEKQVVVTDEGPRVHVRVRRKKRHDTFRVAAARHRHGISRGGNRGGRNHRRRHDTPPTFKRDSERPAGRRRRRAATTHRSGSSSDRNARGGGGDHTGSRKRSGRSGGHTNEGRPRRRRRIKPKSGVDNEIKSYLRILKMEEIVDQWHGALSGLERMCTSRSAIPRLQALDVIGTLLSHVVWNTAGERITRKRDGKLSADDILIDERCFAIALIGTIVIKIYAVLGTYEREAIAALRKVGRNKDIEGRLSEIAIMAGRTIATVIERVQAYRKSRKGGSSSSSGDSGVKGRRQTKKAGVGSGSTYASSSPPPSSSSSSSSSS